MKKFDSYNDVQVNENFERLTLGGHICKIIEAKVVEIKSQKDGKTYEKLALKIDIAEPDKQAGFYERKFANDAKTDALKAKWKGTYQVSVPTDESEDFIKANFKRLITSIEKSNPGYSWTWEESSLPGKVFGGVFALREFTNDMGETISFTECRFARSTEKIEEVEIPKVKLVDGTYMDYQEYVEKKKAERNGKTANNTTVESTETSAFDSDDELPF